MRSPDIRRPRRWYPTLAAGSYRIRQQPLFDELRERHQRSAAGGIESERDRPRVDEAADRIARSTRCETSVVAASASKRPSTSDPTTNMPHTSRTRPRPHRGRRIVVRVRALRYQHASGMVPSCHGQDHRRPLARWRYAGAPRQRLPFEARPGGSGVAVGARCPRLLMHRSRSSSTGPSVPTMSPTRCEPPGCSWRSTTTTSRMTRPIPSGSPRSAPAVGSSSPKIAGSAVTRSSSRHCSPPTSPRSCSRPPISPARIWGISSYRSIAARSPSSTAASSSASSAPHRVTSLSRSRVVT